MIHLVTHSKFSSSSASVQFTKMPGGEMHPTIDPDTLNGNSYTIIADTRNSDDLFSIALTVNAIRRNNNPSAEIGLVIGYVPYARQDRVSNPGEANGIETFADFINGLNLTEVVIHDPHSDVTTALIKRAVVVTQGELLRKWVINASESRMMPWQLNPEEYLLVAPDAGAIKKTDAIAGAFGFSGVVYADKVRDTKTGKIMRTELTRLVMDGESYKLDDMAGSKLLVLDDICDGGRTFIELAKCLQEYNPSDLTLFTTHGLYSKGTQCLLDAGYTRLLTTNTTNIGDSNVESFSFPDDVDSNVFRFRAIDNI